MNDDVQLICFDLGRVLVRICDGWKHACAAAGIAAPTGELDSTANAALHDAVCRSEVGEISIDEFSRRCAPVLGLRPQDVKLISDAYILGVYDGVPQLLSDLKAAGRPTACLSNTNENHWRIMDDPAEPYVAALRQLDHRFASHLLRDRKPNPSIYAKVEDAVKLRGEQIMFFDDLPENVAAARARGWQGHQIAIDSDPVAQIRRHLDAAGIWQRS